MISKPAIFLLTILPGIVLGAVTVPEKHAAPVACERTIFINAAPEVVWQLLTDINSWPHIFKNVSVAKMNRPVSPGVTFRWKAGGASIHSTLRVVNPCRQLAWTGRAYTIAAVHEWQLKAVNNGTELTVTESMNGFIARLFKKSLTRSLGKDMTQSLDELKQASEHSTPGNR